jgi:hypothetical protein
LKLDKAALLSALRLLFTLGQFSQPSFPSSISKPSGMRGASPSSGQREQGIPAAPQPQALGPAQGRPGCSSQTQPQSWHTVHFMAALLAPGCRRQPARFESLTFPDVVNIDHYFGIEPAILPIVTAR